jgi:Ubiquitin family
MATSTADASEDPWSIAIKPVGGTERNFTVSVSPEDALASLHDQIEGETGLKASQQRLIYRGRLIGKSDQVDEIAGDSEDSVLKGTKIKDIVGLCDGQTIHLVEKKETETPQSSSSSADDIIDANSERVLSSGANDQSILTSADGDSGSLSGGNGSASLLAALLGLGGLDDNDSNTERDAASASRQRWGWRSSRLGRRRPHYRLTAEDLEIPDPGSMEPVRQGLMTLHTMLPHAHVTSEQTERGVFPLEACRQFYQGQWIDCLDTVNAWLEATVVEVVKPDEILPPRDIAVDATIHRRRRPQPTNDPAVSANDFDGRRRLLLESCDDDDGEMEEGELAGFRRRSNNTGVSLLLIHYNGWPHRWDEWIRSDSERIRPFRTRTRHPTMVSRNDVIFVVPFSLNQSLSKSFSHSRPQYRPPLSLYLMKHRAQISETDPRRQTEKPYYQS